MELRNITSSMNKDGVFFRNPTHLEEAERAHNQSDIVRSIVESRREPQHEVIKYDEASDSRFMPGTKKIREMDRDSIASYFRNLMRMRPNAYLIRVSLGEYPSMKEVKDRGVRNIGSTSPRSYKDIAEAIAAVFASHNVVEFVYMVDSADPGKFKSQAFVFETNDDEYKNDEFFNPHIEVEYIST